jgi:hypothetical protein
MTKISLYRRCAQHKRSAVALGLISTAVMGAVLVSTAQPSTAATARPQRTLLNATFENLPTGRITPANFKKAFPGTKNYSQATYDDTSIVNVPGRGKVIRTKLDANSYHTYPAGNNGIVNIIPLKRVVTRGCIRYDIRFANNFYWSLGGKLPGLLGVAPGVSPSLPAGGTYAGNKGWSGRMMWVGPKAYSWAGPTNMAVSYMYNPRQTGQYGDNVRWNRAFKANTWHRVRQCYVMNTVGKANGKLQTWFDGKQVVNNTSYVYRGRKDVGISHLAWTIFRGGGDMNWASPQTDYIDIDNVKVTGS